MSLNYLNKVSQERYYSFRCIVNKFREYNDSVLPFYVQDHSTKQQNNYRSHSIYSEKQKSDVYAKFTDGYTRVTFNSSPKSDVSKPQYSELALQYQDTKPVYTNLSTDSQRYVEEPFYRKVDETDRGELPHEEESLPYEENTYYSTMETLPGELANP